MDLNSLSTIGLEITNNCNFNCIHCYLGSENTKYLSMDFISKVLDEIGDNFYVVYLTGGEPFLHPNFAEIYSFIRKRGFLVNILTNASLLNDQILELFNESMPHKLEVSVYGMSEKTTQNVIMNQKFCKKVKNNIKKLSKVCNNILLKYNLLNNNYYELEEFINFCKDLNINYSISFQIIPDLQGNKDIIQYRLNPLKAASIFRKVGLDLRTVHESSHTCDAGKNIFIDSNKVVRGCPVLRTSYDLDISQINNRDLIYQSMENIREFCNGFSDKICPAWIILENEESVRNYIKMVSGYIK